MFTKKPRDRKAGHRSIRRETLMVSRLSSRCAAARNAAARPGLIAPGPSSAHEDSYRVFRRDTCQPARPVHGSKAGEMPASRRTLFMIICRNLWVIRNQARQGMASPPVTCEESPAQVSVSAP